jgi:hypothetical protein
LGRHAGGQRGLEQVGQLDGLIDQIKETLMLPNMNQWLINI